MLCQIKRMCRTFCSFCKGWVKFYFQTSLPISFSTNFKVEQTSSRKNPLRVTVIFCVDKIIMAWNDALNAEWIFKAGVDIFSLS